jgi:hypothetical protein
MSPKQWYRAQIRWAELVEGPQGLRGWQEASYFFLSENADQAFQQALAVGRKGESFYKEGGRRIAVRLAQIVSLDLLGAGQTEFLSERSSVKATGPLPFEHGFAPEQMAPPPSF